MIVQKRKFGRERLFVLLCYFFIFAVFNILIILTIL